MKFYYFKHSMNHCRNIYCHFMRDNLYPLYISLEKEGAFASKEPFTVVIDKKSKSSFRICIR